MKRVTLALYILLFAILEGCDINNGFSDYSTEKISIGDSYQGGLIVYVDETGEHGLIVATEDLFYQTVLNDKIFNNSEIPWSNGYSVITEATGTEMGTGQINTTKTVRAQLGYGNYA